MGAGALERGGRSAPYGTWDQLATLRGCFLLQMHSELGVPQPGERLGFMNMKARWVCWGVATHAHACTHTYAY